ILAYAPTAAVPDRSRLLLAGPMAGGRLLADLHRPAVRQAVQRLGGPLQLPGHVPHFVPTWAGGMFEGLMANLVVPETVWGPRSFGLNDLRFAQVQVKYATQVLNYPVWGMSPSSTPDDTGNYAGYGVEGLTFPVGQ